MESNRLRALLSLAGLVIATVLGLAVCFRGPAIPSVSLRDGTLPESVPPQDSRKPLRIAIGAMITPTEGFAWYWALTEYLQVRLDMPVQLEGRPNYESTNRLIKHGDVDLAFVCSNPYVIGRACSTMDLLVAPQAYGKPEYYSYVLVPVGSPARGLQDLRGKRFVFVDPLSTSGRLAVLARLRELGEDPDGFFGEYDYTYGHDLSIRAVNRGIADGACVDHLIWKYLEKKQPQDVAGTRVIEKLGPFGMPPLVTRKGLDPELREKLKQVLLELHRDPEGARILRGLNIDRFVEVDDHLYDSVRTVSAGADPGPGAEAGGSGGR